MVNHHQHQRSQSFFSRLIRNLSSNSISSSSYHHNGSSSNGDHQNHQHHHRQGREKSSTLRSSGRRPRNVSTYSTVRLQLSSSQSSQDVSSKVTTSPSPSIPQPIELKPLAICGIKNHGNTCFMNAVIQCLSHTDLLAEYFVMSHYKIDLVKHNQLNSCKYGSHGEVTSQCALVFKSLWTNTYSPDISNKFKYLVSKHCKQYEGSDQHDAQEFLFFLLDIFHEDLNIASKKKSKKLKQIQKSWNKPDELVAAETLAYHIACDSSFIHDLFQAQLRSSLVCRSCYNYSNTFDPYMCLSLPVPTKLTHTIIINVSYLDNVTKVVRMVVTIEAQSSLRELRDKISRLVKIPERQLVLLVREHEVGLKELIKDKLSIHEILDDVDDVEIEAIETPAVPDWGYGEYSSFRSPSTTLTPPLSSSQPLTLIWINRVGIGSENKVFGPFFSRIIPRESSFNEIQHSLMKSMASILRKTCDLTIIKDSTLFRLKVIGGLPGKCYLPEDVDHPLYMPTVDKALSHCEASDYRGPIHLKLIIEWDLDLRQTLLVDDEDIITVIDDPNIEFVKAHNEMANTASLKDCFDMYFREERLAADNAWMCPACKRRQQCIKKLSLWSTPDIFIIHLKRFRQASNSLRTKLSTLVTFPLSGLDMNPYLSNRGNNYGDTVDFVNNNNCNNVRNSSSYLPSPWRRPSHDKIGLPRSEDNVYNLYAVCNHHGNMQAGHYTAYCRNIVDGKWYSFDDQNVFPISEKSVVTSDAYILFYQRSTLSFTSPLTSCSGSSNGSSSTSSNSIAIFSSNRPIDHWTYQLSSSISRRPSPGSCLSQDNLLSNSHPGSGSSSHGYKSDHQHVNNYNHPSRGTRAYSTLPSRGSNDTAKNLIKDVRSISPPIKKSQINSNDGINSHTAAASPQDVQQSNTIPSQQQQLTQPKNERNLPVSNGRLASPTHKGIHAVDTGRSPRFRDDLFSCFVGILS